MASDSLFDMRGEAKGFLRAANNTINWGLVILSCPVITKSGIITGQTIAPDRPVIPSQMRVFQPYITQ